MFLPLNLNPSGNRRISFLEVRRCMAPTSGGGSAASRAIALIDFCPEVRPPRLASAVLLSPSIWTRSTTCNPSTAKSRSSMIDVICSGHVALPSPKNVEIGTERSPRISTYRGSPFAFRPLFLSLSSLRFARTFRSSAARSWLARSLTPPGSALSRTPQSKSGEESLCHKTRESSLRVTSPPQEDCLPKSFPSNSESFLSFDANESSDGCLSELLRCSAVASGFGRRNPAAFAAGGPCA
mmetsp:Transcript_86037/g.257815  ORF Transcript_86037/g.257815 Transcript_86037/m.257815 type:complete len:239 (+) Transcript_86037:1139-1855(+)